MDVSTATLPEVVVSYLTESAVVRDGELGIGSDYGGRGWKPQRAVGTGDGIVEEFSEN